MSFRHEDLPTGGKKGEHHHPTASGTSGPSPKLVGAVVLAIVIGVFIIANDHDTQIKFVFFTWDTTVRWSIFIALVLGVLLDRLVIWGMRRRKQNEFPQATEETEQ
jgi:uncharacterized integral membrane protein